MLVDNWEYDDKETHVKAGLLSWMCKYMSSNWQSFHIIMSPVLVEIGLVGLLSTYVSLYE